MYSLGAARQRKVNEVKVGTSLEPQPPPKQDKGMCD